MMFSKSTKLTEEFHTSASPRNEHPSQGPDKQAATSCDAVAEDIPISGVYFAPLGNFSS